ncbi:MAG: hypothetical protein QXZ13_03865 [Candidatus Diapherotrites archaeon]
MEIKKENEKAQASVTDAIYFLLVVTFLSIFLFGFAGNYGKNVKEQIDNEFETTFAANALKTILYSSTPRDPQKSLFDEKTEVDYLLAIIKEDYADDQELGEEERKVIAKTIKLIMAPIQDTKDYAFILFVPPESGRQQKIIYFFIHLTNFKKEEAKDPKGNVIPGRFMNYYVEDTKTHVDYFCGIGTTDFTELNRKIKRLLNNVSPVSQASAVIRMIDNRSQATFPAQAELYLWDAMWLGPTQESISDNKEPLFYEEPTTPLSVFNCREFT